MLPRVTALLVAPLAALTIAACGDDDNSGTDQSASTVATGATTATTVAPTETTDASAGDASARARELARETRDLQEEVTASARALVTGSGDSRERARKRLAEQEGRARDLAETARDELDADQVVRDALVQANERTAKAASTLQEFAKNGQQSTLQQARSTLAQGEKDLRGAADDLLSRAPSDARKALEDALKDLPDIP
jgi:hypothetical protein